jgi:hypothetical protein
MKIKRLTLLVIIPELLIVILAINNYGFTIEGLQAVTRFSGRFSLLIFSVLFILIPRQRNQVHQLFFNKPFLVFAVAHGIHLVELLTYVYLSANPLIPVRLAGGFLAYVLIFSLPILQQRYETGKLSEKKYLLAETIYLYYVWFIFFMSYLPRVQGKLPNVGGSYQEFVILLAWVCILLGMKLSTLLTSRIRLGLKR